MVEERVREPSPVTVNMDHGPSPGDADEDILEDTAADGDQTAHCRGHSDMLEQMERTLRSAMVLG